MPEVTAADVEEVCAVNVLGPVRVLHAFLPLLRRSPAGVVVDVSSGLGSHEVTSTPGRVESSFQLPGCTATDLNGHSGPQSVEEGAEIIAAMASIGPDGPTGTFSDRHASVGW